MAFFGRILYDSEGDNLVPAMPSESTVSTRNGGSNQHLSLILISGASVVVTCFLLLTYYIVLLRHRFSHADEHRTPSHISTLDAEDEDSESEQHHHHVWYIRTVGLDAGTIESIPSFALDGRDVKTDGMFCSVCLSELTEGEFVRLLPKCGHIFHVSCIDTWLSSHVNCPLCRDPAVVAAAPSSLETTALEEEERQ